MSALARFPDPLKPLYAPIAVSAALVVLFAVSIFAQSTAEVEQALAQAGDNRAELERVLAHYRAAGDAQKLQAAEFLIANMPGNGYIVFGLYDEKKNEYAFDALEHKNLDQAQGVLDALEKEHGKVDFAHKSVVDDLKTMRADYLIENIELAFQAWREKPWARTISFETFCETILPYRGSNEPIDAWRKPLMERCAGLPAKMKDPGDRAEAAGLAYGEVGWFGFSDLYYVHPTDQGFSEMSKNRLGRCEDITNLQTYAMRANAIPAAADYTPFWADRDNNHAWQVLLDEQGEGRAGLGNRAAKVYRKSYALQKRSLGALKREDEEVPRWLSGRNFRDVTSQYQAVSDVNVRLTLPAPKPQRFAYLCVFNGGEWQAIHWGAVEGEQVVFTAMGRNIAYLPAWYVDKKVAPAAPAFVLSSAGEVRPLVPVASTAIALEIGATRPATPDADTRRDLPRLVVEPGHDYELYLWRGGWESLGTRMSGSDPVRFEAVPSNGLYWLVQQGSRKLERIFTIETGRQVWW